MGWHVTWGEEERSFPWVLLAEGVLMGERSQVLEKACGSQAGPEESIFSQLSILGNHQSNAGTVLTPDQQKKPPAQSGVG